MRLSQLATELASCPPGIQTHRWGAAGSPRSLRLPLGQTQPQPVTQRLTDCSTLGLVTTSRWSVSLECSMLRGCLDSEYALCQTWQHDVFHSWLQGERQNVCRPAELTAIHAKLEHSHMPAERCKGTERLKQGVGALEPVSCA